MTHTTLESQNDQNSIDAKTDNASDNVLYDNRNRRESRTALRRRRSNSDHIYDNRKPSNDDFDAFYSDDSTSRSSIEDAHHVYDNRNFQPDLEYYRRAKNDKVIYDNREPNIKRMSEVSSSSNSSLDLQDNPSEESLDSETNQAEYLQLHLSQGGSTLDATLEEGDNNLETGSQRGLRNVNKTLCSVDYAEIKPLRIHEDLRNDAFEMDSHVYSTSAIAEQGDEQFHVRKTNINNPLYNIDT